MERIVLNVLIVEKEFVMME